MMDRAMDEQNVGWKDRWMDGQMDRTMEGCQIDRQMEVQNNGWMGRVIDKNEKTKLLNYLKLQ